MKLLASLKSKGLLILCIVLGTLFVATYISGKDDRDELQQTRDKLLQHVTLNKSLSDENLRLTKEVKERPKEYIPLTKEMMSEVCKGSTKQELIKQLPSTKKEVVDDKTTVDIDDRLPADLIKLLQ